MEMLMGIFEKRAIVLSFLWIALFAFVKIKKTNYFKKFMLVSAMLYGVALIEITLLLREQMKVRIVKTFLWEYNLALHGDVEMAFDIINNILLFVPFEMMGSEMLKITSNIKMVKRKLFFVAIIGSICSLSIELI